MIVLLDKQTGVTSFAALSALKGSLGVRKIGHTGTLDSFASGLLVVLTGNLTRLAPYILNLDKAYTATIAFGAETDTLDPLGDVTARAPLPTEEALRQALPRFTGPLMQEPPQYSALKVGGRRASDLARKGREVNLPPRPITVYGLRLDGVTGDDTEAGQKTLESAVITVTCSSGTYIRALARDIARECGSRAHLSALRRTRVGGFSVEDARGEPLEFGPAMAEKAGLGALSLKREHRGDFFTGRPIAPEWFQSAVTDGVCAARMPRHVDAEFLPGKNSAVTDDANYAVFTGGAFVGVAERREGRFSYGFVARGGPDG
ncbi:MAG: tRNA pseudouridine(55) synthase TruB [Spirochaetaceae bacterium]|jgi:tRNA pseudouridine55 synthase|nr:tRNA pseudouridine(55) synthase TruB [Spirochaetaceae bacterium]